MYILMIELNSFNGSGMFLHDQKHCSQCELIFSNWLNDKLV